MDNSMPIIASLNALVQTVGLSRANPVRVWTQLECDISALLKKKIGFVKKQWPTSIT